MGHGNEADFPKFLHKSVRHWSLTLHFEPFRFWLRKTTRRLGTLELEQLFQCRQKQGHPEERGHCEPGHFQGSAITCLPVAGSRDEILGGGGGAGGAEARRSRLCLCTLHQPRNQRQARSSLLFPEITFKWTVSRDRIQFF